MAHYGSVEIEGDPSKPKIVSELKEHSIKAKHIDKAEEFVFKKLFIEDDKGVKHKLEVKDNKLLIKKEVRTFG